MNTRSLKQEEREKRESELAPCLRAGMFQALTTLELLTFSSPLRTYVSILSPALSSEGTFPSGRSHTDYIHPSLPPASTL